MPVPKSFLNESEMVKGALIGTVEEVTPREEGVSILLSKAVFSKEEENNSYHLSKVLIYSKEINLYTGMRVVVNGTLSNFQVPTNPGEFNSNYYYNSKSISCWMQADNVDVLDSHVDYFSVFLQKIRNAMIHVYQTWLPEEKAGLLSAMFLGEKQGLMDETERLYQKSGIAHLLAVSGLHVSMIGMAVYQGMLSLLKRKKCAIVLAALVVVCYGAMTGFGVATKRAVIMLLVSFLAVLIGRTYDMLSAASFSAVLILAFHPLEIRNSGFLLSFGAVLGISVVYPALVSVLEKEAQKKNSILEFVAKPFLLSASIQLVTFPVVLNSFYEYPRYGIILNLIVIPLVSLLAGLSMAAGLVGSVMVKAGAVFAGGIYVILEIYETLASFFLNLPYSTVVTGKPQASYFVIYYVVLVGTLLLWQFFRSKKVWLCLLILLFIPKLSENPGLTITFVDVGQGDGIYLQTKEKLHILVDGGSSNKKKLGKYTLEPFLKSQGCKTLDYVFLSHLDADHISGVMELIDNIEKGGIEIKTIVFGEGVVRDEAYEKVIDKVTEAGIRICAIKREQTIQMGELRIRCIHPGKMGGEDRNEASLALEVFYGEVSFLLTGDMGESENEAVSFLERKQYTFLKVGHHGSNGSSSDLFLEKVNPEYAIISCASKNRYGHPGKDAIERLEKAGCNILYTKTGGAVTISTDGKKFILDYFKNNL